LINLNLKSKFYGLFVEDLQVGDINSSIFHRLFWN